MSRRNCSVFGCPNIESKCEGKDPKIYFYRFPGRPYEAERKKKWIHFVKRKNYDGTAWKPTSNSRVCSNHFVGNKKSQHPLDPNFNPTIFPLNELEFEGQQFSARHVRSQGRKLAAAEAGAQQNQKHGRFSIDDPTFDVSKSTHEGSCIHVHCQTDFDGYQDTSTPCSMFICMTLNGESATQVKHAETTNVSTAIDCQISNESIWNPYKSVACLGDDSLKHNEPDLRELTSVNGQVFYHLMSLLTSCQHRNRELRTEDKLLLFLFKLKLGISFSAIGKLFGIHQCTAKRCFVHVLAVLKIKTRDWIFWPSKERAKPTMPECFKEMYPNCRMIIDCIEIKTEKPATVFQQNLMYSRCKGSHTLKFLIAITPGGYISFISKPYGGRASDSYITNDSGILLRLESGDEIIADKYFTHIKTACGAKNVTLVMPPFSKSESADFSLEHANETYKVANVRIHIERVIQCVKTFKILNNRIPADFITYMDDVMHVCCVLANLQTPISKRM